MVTMKLTGAAVWPKKECFSVSSVRTAFAAEVIFSARVETLLILLGTDNQ